MPGEYTRDELDSLPNLDLDELLRTWHRPIAQLRRELDLPEAVQAGIGILEEAA